MTDIERPTTGQERRRNVILEPATATILGLLYSRIQINSENTHRKSKLSA
jgi:hypothetical protein